MLVSLLILIIAAFLAGAVLGILAVLVIGIRRGDRGRLTIHPAPIRTRSRGGFSSASATPRERRGGRRPVSRVTDLIAAVKRRAPLHRPPVP